MKEAEIFISGIKLSFAQSMTVRVAIESFAGDIEDEQEKVFKSYKDRINEIRALIMITAE